MVVAPRTVQSTKETKILLAMRWELVRRGIAEMLREVSGSSFGFKATAVGEAGELDEVFRLGRDVKPDAVICRGNLLGLDVREFTERIQKATGHPVSLIILSREMNPVRVLDACAAGVAAYLPAEIDSLTLATALLAVRSGTQVLCKEARDALLRGTQRRAPGRLSSPDVVDGLTARERDVIELVAGGLSNKEIAYRLGIGRRTAEMHVARLIDKFGMASRSELLVELLS